MLKLMIASNILEKAATFRDSALALALGIAVVAGLAQGVGTPAFARAKKVKNVETVKTSTVVARPDGDVAAVQAQLINFSRILALGDAAALASLWTADGEYIDEDGAAVKGRDDIQQRFALVFNTNGKPQIQLISEEVKFLSPTVALVEGKVQRNREGNAISDSRFSLVMVKGEAGWLFSRVSERAALTASSNYDHLKQLDWIIGEWSAQNGNASVHMRAEWMPNKNFIVCKYDTKKANGATSIDMQIIGWDPLEEKPRSWHFDNSGGYGQGFWSKVGSQWVCDTSGVESDGSVTRSKNLMNVTGANGFTWSSVQRSVNGMAVGDASALAVQRVSK
ncbi:MAG: SgcJ/EcaC family oxidoreductase [Cyanobacteria bacterium REEB67]|nr:SgcJ/EcaC family oxidoreductase [Cyanobacteria bacterium REEB67]